MQLQAAVWGHLGAVGRFQPTAQDSGPQPQPRENTPGCWACLWALCVQLLQEPGLAPAPP